MDKQLTEKQSVFCSEYLKDFNATQSALRAGYAKKSARQQGARLLSNAAIQSRITELVGKRIVEVNYDAKMLLSDILEVFDAAKKQALNGGPQQIAAFKGMAEIAGKHVIIQAFKERIEVDVNATLIDKLNAAQARSVLLHAGKKTNSS